MGNSKKTKAQHEGFAIAEIVVALAFMALLTLIVGGLGQQAMNYSKSTRQIASVLEIRNRVGAAIKSPDKWLKRLRGADEIGIFARCIPDSSTPTACDAADANITANDLELQNETVGMGGNYAPLVDALGNKIAGTLADPLYLDADGRACSGANASTSCPLKSVGYFFRENFSTTAPSAGDPGQVKFLVKIEKNNLMANKTPSPPFKRQLISLNVAATDLKISPGSCAAGAIKIGYQRDGSLACINPVQDCPTPGEVAVGISSTGATVCRPMISCSGTQKAIIENNNLKCVDATPCNTNEAHFGYDSVTGAAICRAPNLSCSNANEVLLGANANGTAKCLNLPACATGETLTYNSSGFDCVTISTSSSSSPPSVAQSCLIPGQVMTGLDAAGKPICSTLAALNAATPPTSPRPLLVQQVSITAQGAYTGSQMFNGHLWNSVNSMGLSNTDRDNLYNSCEITENGVSKIGSKGYYGDLSYCIIYVCRGATKISPLFAQVIGNCGVNNSGSPCFNKFRYSLSCMY